MAHQEQRDYFTKLTQLHPQFFTDVSVLEVGSLNINGTVRDFFNATEYLGIDVAPGAGVDLVMQGQDITFAKNSYDIAVSAECFEHNPYWKETFKNMVKVAKKAVIFTCASDGRPEHGTTRTDAGSSPFTADWDYYQNLNEEDFRSAFNLDSMFKEYEFEVNTVSHDLYFCGIK
jgi:SAM-dependent methyltransferase